MSHRKSEIKLIKDWKRKFDANPKLKNLKYLKFITVGTNYGRKTRVFVYCKECGHNEWRDAGNVVSGRGCNHCIKSNGVSAKMTPEKHIQRLVETTYIKRQEISKLYKNNRGVQCFEGTCSICGTLWKGEYDTLLGSKGCKVCNKIRKREKLIKSKLSIAYKKNKLLENTLVLGFYANKYSQIMLNCSCKDCGNLWNPRLDDLIISNGCPDCSCLSGPEERLKEWLLKNKVAFYTQKKFPDCRYKNPLPFDFYLPKYNILCEIQGGQHTRPIDYWGGVEGFIYRKKLDKIKKDYALNNGYNYVEIFEEDVEDLGVFLKNEINKLK